MKVYLAKDWTGSHVFAEPPKTYEMWRYARYMVWS